MEIPLNINMLTALVTNVFQIPVGAKLLHVREQGDNLCMWFEVDTMAHREERKFQIFGTGHALIREGLEYVGTGMFADGDLVLHVYEIKAEKEA